MNKLLLYAIFHANLNFSYISEDLYPQILRRCYWPLLRIIQDREIPLGLEFSAYTLEVVNRLDPTFVLKLREMWADGLCEVVGSGYVQAIMPLIPSRVNRHNLRRGNEIYQELLGKKPTVAYVNELVYSAGLPKLYYEAGYRTLVVNWESAIPAHDQHENRYQPCAVSLDTWGSDQSLPIIWHSLETYRDFQQYVENEISLDDYMSRLLSHLPESGHRAVPLYSSDWEVFDFKPWRVYPEGFQHPELGEFERIEGLLTLLKNRKDIEFVTPTELTERFPNKPLVHPESAAYPLTYKKQEDHSLTRWAVSGRDNVRFNTQCHQLFQQLQLADWYLSRDQAPHNLPDNLPDNLQEERIALWQELCFLWSSDFRTFTTEEKFLGSRNRMGTALDRARRLNECARPLEAASGKLWIANCSLVPSELEPVSLTISANGDHNYEAQSYGLQFNGQTVPCQVTQRVSVREDASVLTLEALPHIAADQSGPMFVHSRDNSATFNRHDYKIDLERHMIETDTVRLRLLPEQGGNIDTLEFPSFSSQPLICRTDASETLPGIQPDYLLPGDLALEDWSGRKIHDHQNAQIQYPVHDEGTDIFFPVRCTVETDVGTVWKTYRIYLGQPRVDLSIRFQWRDVVPKSFRLGRMNLNPKSFDRNTLRYITVNGGEDLEEFSFIGQSVRQDDPAKAEFTASGCLGATEGWVVLKDAAKGIGLVTRQASLYSIPLIHFDEKAADPDEFLLTLAYSLGEWDQTSHTLWRGHSTWSLSILGGGEDIVAKTRACALLANGGLVSLAETG